MKSFWTVEITRSMIVERPMTVPHTYACCSLLSAVRKRIKLQEAIDHALLPQDSRAFSLLQKNSYIERNKHECYRRNGIVCNVRNRANRFPFNTRTSEDHARL